MTKKLSSTSIIPKPIYRYQHMMNGEMYYILAEWVSAYINSHSPIHVEIPYILNILTRRKLQLMKATVLAESYYILSIFILICRLQQCPLTVTRQASLSFLLVNIFLIILTFQVFLYYISNKDIQHLISDKICSFCNS